MHSRLKFFLTNDTYCFIVPVKAYSISEAARILGVGRVTLHRWIRDKLVPTPATRIIAGVRLRFWTDSDLVKLREYKAARYWGKGGRRRKGKPGKKN